MNISFVRGWKSPVISEVCPLHAHLFAEIVYHHSGAGWTELEDGSRFDFAPGTVIIYPANAGHLQVMIEPGIDVVVQLEIKPEPRELKTTLRLDYPGNPTFLAELDFLCNPSLKRTPGQQRIYDHRAAAVFLSLLSAAAELPGNIQETPQAYYAEKACRIILEKYQTLPSVAAVADMISISYDHLRHVFKDRYGFSLQDWLTRTRIERAKELLLHSTLPLKTIAPLCGFGTDRHLCAVFREHTKLTPGQYRKKTTDTG
jgi:AraC-like DNA-binding protein